MLPQGKPKLDNLEFVLNFEKFDKPKTNTNVSDWLFESFKAANVKHSDLNQLAADGASNAIGSVSEYESLSRTERANDMLTLKFVLLIKTSALVGMHRALLSLHSLLMRNSGMFC